MPDAEKVLVGVRDLLDAKRLKEKLAEIGVELELSHNKETCRKGCHVTVEIWADPAELPKIQEVLKEERSKLLADFDFDPQQSDQIFNPDKETAVCPACGTAFSTKLKECPECGLVFAIKE